MGQFTVSQKTDLANVAIGDVIPESDFALVVDNKHFVQLKYTSDDNNKPKPFIVGPGIWSIVVQNNQLKLQATSFVTNKLLDTFIKTKEVTDKIDCFFRNLHIYKEEGIEIPKRGVLLHGAPGGGKTSVINKVANKYVEDGKTAVIVWTTDKFESYQVKDFIKTFNYEGVDKLILVVEDIGGTEINAPGAMRSDASLLSLLDNQEKTFTIPVLILATTNYPANMMGNLTNRPERFDDKIAVTAPSAAERVMLFDFFINGRDFKGYKEAVDLLKGKSTEGFTPAHVKKIIVNARIYEKSVAIVVQEMVKEVEEFKKGFEETKRSMGIGISDE